MSQDEKMSFQEFKDLVVSQQNAVYALSGLLRVVINWRFIARVLGRTGAGWYFVHDTRPAACTVVGPYFKRKDALHKGLDRVPGPLFPDNFSEVHLLWRYPPCEFINLNDRVDTRE